MGFGSVGGFEGFWFGGLVLGSHWARIGGVLGRLSRIGIAGLAAGCSWGGVFAAAGARGRRLAVVLGGVPAGRRLVWSGHEHSSWWWVIPIRGSLQR